MYHFRAVGARGFRRAVLASIRALNRSAALFERLLPAEPEEDEEPSCFRGMITTGSSLRLLLRSCSAYSFFAFSHSSLSLACVASSSRVSFNVSGSP